ncbi:DUF1127 domain-containing protein [Brucella pseudogrignonensis]|uniref:Uncharacterized protein YjiS (DUF1127 family) n=1 Tax=Brucella pseudogrignonensis TaxID=419475 RepID=A0ABU1M5T0_9HYPH|nr:DUF1127 domain-containing protein [Brucella pseudogrignonensis]MDR6431187.1 uncharacterized protein YjiS (DUF1127 family) [Brucella pseudogrignonensis]
MTFVPIKYDEIDTIDTMRAAEREIPVSTRSIWQRFVAWFSHRTMLRRSRIELMDLTDEQLKDIGLSRSAADMEARKVRFHIR